MFTQRFGVSTPWRSAPAAVRRLEDATDPKRRARLAAGRRAFGSGRLLGHLAALRPHAGAAPESPAMDAPQTTPRSGAPDQHATQG